MNQTTTAVIYARVSSSGSQESRQDTTRQVKDLESLAQQKSLTLMKTFEEHVSGAKSRNERPYRKLSTIMLSSN